MDQGGFDFRKPSDRREARRFEPPPWEQEAFEALKLKREEAEAREAEQLAEAVKAAEHAVQPVPVAPAQQPVPVQMPAQDAVEDATRPQAVVAPMDEPPKKAEVDEARMIEMMAGLAVETPRSRSMAMSVTLGVGGFLTLLGVGLSVWGVMQTAKAEGPGRTLSMMLVVMGLAYAAVGVSLGYRALKERGVL
ncbi:MAG TPA: hypothetical protein VFG89_00715 [Coriobacteriia bacterium]|nr:hypothetical protein [Coriobacteriia bacterium]